MVGCDDSASDSLTSSEATICSTVGTTWWNQSFTEERDRFHVELAVTPSRNNTDAVVGLASGAATQWTSLAAIVRFNPQGMIDARSGSTYRADTAVPYQGGTTYYVRFDVDVRARTYSARVGTQPGVWTWSIGTNYSFRTEQAGVTKLDHVAGYVSPSVGGSLQVCDVTVVSETPPGCTVQYQSSGYANRVTTASTTVQIVSVDIRPSTANMDGVFGVANGAVDAFGDFAVSMRFATNGLIEARDGDVYRAERAVTYVPGRQYKLYFVIDLPSKTYSLYLRNDENIYDTIARNYRFRTQQATTSRVDHVASIVDSAAGALEICNLRAGPNPELLSAHAGWFDVHPLADGSALIAESTRIMRVGSNHVPTASVTTPDTGAVEVTADPAGNVYVASLRAEVLTVRAYTAALAPRWTQTYAVPNNHQIRASVITSAGHLAVALTNSSGQPTHVHLIDSFGPYRGVTNLFPGSNAIAMSPNGFVVAMGFPDTYGYEGNEVQIWRHGAPGALVRSRQFVGDFAIGELSLAPDDSVVLGGWLDAPMTFDGCTIAPLSNDEVYWQAYVTALQPDLATRFCKRLTTDVTGIASDNTRIAVAYHTRTQLYYVDTVVYDRAGNEIAGTQEDAFVGAFGMPGELALAPDGRLFVQVFASFMSPTEPRWPFLAIVRP